MLERTLGQCLLRAGDGHTEAFTPIVHRYERPLFSFLARMTASDAVAAELTQETLLRAFRSCSSFSAGSPVTPWIFRIARNLAIDHLRRAEHRFMATTCAVEDLDVVPAAMRLDGEGQLLARGQLRAVERALASLRPRAREVLLLGLVHQMSYSDMSEVTGDSVSAVKARFLRARLALRRQLEAEDAES